MFDKILALGVRVTPKFVIVESTTYNDWKNNIEPILKDKARFIATERWKGIVVCKKHNIEYCTKLLKANSITSLILPYQLPSLEKRSVKKI